MNFWMRKRLGVIMYVQTRKNLTSRQWFVLCFIWTVGWFLKLNKIYSFKNLLVIFFIDLDLISVDWKQGQMMKRMNQIFVQFIDKMPNNEVIVSECQYKESVNATIWY